MGKRWKWDIYILLLPKHFLNQLTSAPIALFSLGKVFKNTILSLHHFLEKSLKFLAPPRLHFFWEKYLQRSDRLLSLLFFPSPDIWCRLQFPTAHPPKQWRLDRGRVLGCLLQSAFFLLENKSVLDGGAELFTLWSVATATHWALSHLRDHNARWRRLHSPNSSASKAAVCCLRLAIEKQVFW